ncbi:MAG: DNA alkylation repair enzyme [Methanosaeta sp. PtaB.Bin039]|nr:MAG: DNA alkylation repair enzyme [Methanosaeta sp. PtaB.Bin039]OPY44442.1 MAG: DNA alkylation repair enzyme [Methanosaeta sp. PtaU1.Bin028]HOT06955.1 DNA alkylation repair protein [Methanotrichaceae archaeon]HQF17159.1 DNA alkylation repair protein [Methanotrichaceae archaeon]HQI91559.1 DNA alkylation repair protein [Methanotrichaceae archaeon]
MEDGLIAAVRADLVRCADETVRDGAQRFFKEDVKFHGVRSGDVRKIANRHFRNLKGRDKGEIFYLCEELLKSGYGEEAFIAFEWAFSIKKRFVPKDFDVFKSWIEKYVDNWAKCDTICNHTLGSFIEMYPEHIADLKAWTMSENRWLRRASAVTLILPARKGMFLRDVLEISDLLLKDEDDLVQKGYGWMLKEASKIHQEEVFDYVMSRKSEMPRTALRYSIEKMPEDLRRQAMQR